MYRPLQFEVQVYIFCHFLFCSSLGGGGLVAKLCLTLCDPMDDSLPGSSVHGIFQARIMEWVAISFSNPSLIQLIYTYYFRASSYVISAMYVLPAQLCPLGYNKQDMCPHGLCEGYKQRHQNSALSFSALIKKCENVI